MLEVEGSQCGLEDGLGRCGERRRHSRQGEGRQRGLVALLERRLVVVLDCWQVPGARPASSMTRTPVNGGGEVAMKVGTASLVMSSGHDKEGWF